MSKKPLAVTPTNQSYTIKSPDEAITVQVETGDKLRWSVRHKSQPIIKPSSISLQLGNGEVSGDKATVKSSEIRAVDTEFKAINFRRAVIKDRYTHLILVFENDFGVEFRVYNDAVAYRFFVQRDGGLIVKNEETNFNFTADHPAFIPYLWDYREGQIFNASFESPYTDNTFANYGPAGGGNSG